ncbi:MAG: hypothetical protein QGF36_05470, partial [Candidatus Marinimicrobia bacterium]|nr:hypothetical protein [Candidatus Neomarinimicrobiota bacterium]
MKSMYLLTLFVVVFSCGGDSSTAPSGPSYHSNEETFLNELTSLNSLEADSLEGRITLDDPEVTGENYDRIVALDLSGLDISELPSSVGGLEYIKELNLSGNQLSDLPGELCTIYSNGGVSINIDNNLLCDPVSITPCVLLNISVEFKKQNCENVYHDEEFEFIIEFISANSADSLSKEIFNGVVWSWDEDDSTMVNEIGQHVNRITEIEWNNMELDSIPETIRKLEDLKTLELENNLLKYLPSGITSLSQL